MDFLRHAGRHVLHSVANYVEEQLDELLWTQAEGVPFGAARVKLIRTPAFVGGSLDKNIQAGIVSVSLGDEFAPNMEELGGALASQEYPLFFDVFQDSNASALTLATDIRDILLGRLPGTQRWLDVIDQAFQTPVPGWKLEFEDVERVQPETSSPLNWQVVKVVAVAYFPEVTY